MARGAADGTGVGVGAGGTAAEASEAPFGPWLRARLGEVGRGPAQLGRYLDGGTPRVVALLAGRAQPTAGECEAIASALGLPPRVVRQRAGVGPSRGAASAPPAETRRPRMETPAPPAPPAPTTAAVAQESAAVAAELVPNDSPSNDGATTPDSEPKPAPPARSPRRRRPAAAEAPVAPPPPVALISAEQIAGLRSLADDLDRAVRDHDELRAEVERLRAERDRLTAEIEQHRARLERVRAAVLAAEA
jgi:hypothetical protein